MQVERRCLQEAKEGEGQLGGNDPAYDKLIMEMTDEFELNRMGEDDDDEDKDDDDDKDNDRGDPLLPHHLVLPPR
jgi:hypothetical protein